MDILGAQSDFYKVCDAIIRAEKEKDGDYGSVPVKFFKKNGKVLSRDESRKEIANAMNLKFNAQKPHLRGDAINVGVKHASTVAQDTVLADESSNYKNSVAFFENWHDGWTTLMEEVVKLRLADNYKQWRKRIDRAIDRFSDKKAFGDDLVPMSFRHCKASYRIKDCHHEQAIRAREYNARVCLGLAAKLNSVPPNSDCGCKAKHRVTVSVRKVIVERLALLITLELIPPYLGECRIVALSKVKSPIIETIKQLRPIGILSVF